MDLDGYEFSRASAINADRDANGSLVLDVPHQRFANLRGLPLNANGLGPFIRVRVAGLPPRPGVYAVVRGPNEVLYIGRAQDSIAARWGATGYAVIYPRNCFRGGQSTNCRINNLIRLELENGAELSLWTYTTPECVAMERQLIARLQPAWNLQGRLNQT